MGTFILAMVRWAGDKMAEIRSCQMGLQLSYIRLHITNTADLMHTTVITAAARLPLFSTINATSDGLAFRAAAAIDASLSGLPSDQLEH